MSSKKIQTNRLQDLLDLWEDAGDDHTSAQIAAQQLLETVEGILASGGVDDVGRSLWHQYLNVTGKSEYLLNLSGPEQRTRWAETTFACIQRSDYSLRHMFAHRVSENPRKILFQDMFSSLPTRWTYEQIAVKVRETAAVFHSAGSAEPRVAIFADNSVESACCDLACLLYDIPDTPLNPHFDEIILAGIFNRLKITIAVTDTEDRRKRLLKVRKMTDDPFEIFVLTPDLPGAGEESPFLGRMCKQLSRERVDSILAGRERRSLDRVATVMFTSGSTGEPKGVSFSLYNLVTKRFARAAALPGVGRDEILLCYLPLYHTFGRYFEMLGAIYWGGTYVFAGSPSSDRLMSLFPQVNPTGFVSVPIRWGQLQERAVEMMVSARDDAGRSDAFRGIVGTGLRWGISAAGYLSPKVFRFFQTNGVELCSGFGMTEATGGITMTPPGDYVDNTTGIPLPGVRTRLRPTGELEISGHYIARYLDDAGPDEIIPFPGSQDSESWIRTGDIFRIRPDGYHEIVDRVKDIFKNSKGQTIAPQRLERRFHGVPGVKRVCLVGEGRAYNVLLVVPDREDPVLTGQVFNGEPKEYFRKLVTAANHTLAPYERAVNFTLLDRDFETDRDELTPKGSLKRKVIEANFAGEIETLYGKDVIELFCNDCRVRIPPWFYRDLGILEDDIRTCPRGLINRIGDRILPIQTHEEESTVLIGDLEYRLADRVIDLGLFARQPRLWMGNPALIAFCPCREGWDAPLGDVSPQVFRPLKSPRTYSLEEMPLLDQVRDPVLVIINKLLSSALHGEKETALQSIRYVGEELREADDRLGDVIWRRLEALSHHPDEDMRCEAYKVLLLDEPAADFSRAFPTFILSGLSFLNRESIKSIAFAKFEQRRLDALRKRLFTYRRQLEWPVPDTTRHRIEEVLELLSGFVDAHPVFYNSVRAEMASWVLHKTDRALAEAAGSILEDLIRRYESNLAGETPEPSSVDWNAKLLFDDMLLQAEVRRIRKILIGTTFLKQSIILAFDERSFECEDVAEGGIWVSRTDSPYRYRSYRLSVRTRAGKHYSLQLVLSGKMAEESVFESVCWHAAIEGYPFGMPILPRLGCYRPELGAYSLRYLGDLTVWEHIRQSSGSFEVSRTPQEQYYLYRLFVQGLGAFFRGWIRSEGQIVPGSVSPDNVVVSELDFQESARILSLTGWCDYKNTLSLVRPMLRNFYEKTLAHYPPSRGELDVRWIFEACIEAVGEESAMTFFDDLGRDLEQEPLLCLEGRDLGGILSDYRREMATQYYVPLPLRNAIEKYSEWERLNPGETAAMRERTIIDLYHSYQLDRLPEVARYYLYRHTYFARAEEKIAAAFDTLLEDMRQDRTTPGVLMVALSDLQVALKTSDDREVFSRMVFPRLPAHGKVDVQKIGEKGVEQIIIRSRITDKMGRAYTCWEAAEPVEIGELYRLFFLEHHPLPVSVQNQHYIVVDSHEEIVGGICWIQPEEDIVELKGIMIVSSLTGQGIGSVMMDDFCTRMAGRGVRIIKAPSLSRNFFLECGFSTDRRWSGLVMVLSPAGC